MNVADAMTPRSSLVTVELPGSRDDALGYLQDRAFSSVPVVKQTDDGEVYRGLVSRESLIEHPGEDQLALLMEDVPTTTQGTAIEELARLMVESGARRVPVVDGELEGIITITDVVRAMADGDVPGDTEVGELASRSINATWAGTPLGVVERELSYADEPYAVVLDDHGEMTGIVTAVDIVAVAEVVEGEEETGASIADEDDTWMWEGIKAVGNSYLPTRDVEFPDGPVSEYMTADLETISGRKRAQEAAQRLIANDIEQLPMVSGDELVGIVKDVHLLEALYD